VSGLAAEQQKQPSGKAANQGLLPQADRRAAEGDLRWSGATTLLPQADRGAAEEDLR
jgi:hypothetical protein